jgi:hypothetical protein
MPIGLHACSWLSSTHNTLQVLQGTVIGPGASLRPALHKGLRQQALFQKGTTQGLFHFVLNLVKK